MQETGEHRKILIVEDEADIRQVLSFFLKQAGFEVQAVAGGQEAIDILPSYQPHLVILDILMRPVSGWQVLQWIRTTYDDNTIPVLILTALVQFSEQMQGLERGAVDYVTKPMHRRRVVERLLDMSVEQRLLLRQVYMNERRQILDQLAAAQVEEF